MSVTLLLGPDFAVLWQEAQRMVPVGTHRFSCERLSAEAARAVAASDRHGRYFVIGLDGAVEAAQHMLLKTLEEGQSRFILVSTSEPLPTVMSRCQDVRRYGPAARSAGPEESKAAAAVSQAMRAVYDSDQEALARVLRGWGEAEHAALHEWACCCATGRWRPPLECPPGTKFPPEYGRTLLLALSGAGSGRPKLAAQAVLGARIGQ